MKKIFVLGVVLSVLFVAQSAFAMTFSQPVKIGQIGYLNQGGFELSSASSNKGEPIVVRGRTLSKKGVAIFGDGSDALYFHYALGTREKRGLDIVTAFGGNDIKNTISITNMKMPDLYKISTDQKITLYSIEDGNDLDEEDRYILIGKRADGVFVEYFDTDKIRQRYFGKQWSGIRFYDIKFQGNTIVIRYDRNTQGKGFASVKYKADEHGEFRFKWDDAAQWFSVEQIVY